MKDRTKKHVKGGLIALAVIMALLFGYLASLGSSLRISLDACGRLSCDMRAQVCVPCPPPPEVVVREPEGSL